MAKECCFTYSECNFCRQVCDLSLCNCQRCINNSIDFDGQYKLLKLNPNETRNQNNKLSR